MANAVITGGSKGLGRALALALADDGWDVVITARTQDTLDDVARDGSPNTRAIGGDMRDESHRARLADMAGPTLDLLVNNASRLGPSPLLPIGEVDESELHAVFNTNVVSPLALLGRVLPALKQGDGVVINVSSDAGVEAYETWGPYGASKAALDHASAVLAREEPGLKVYAFDPGDMRTEMHQAAFPGDDISDRPLPETVVPVLRYLVSSGLPSGRYATSDLREDVR